MLRIVPHLEKLLMVQDFVTVPRFGGFVLQAVPASYRKDMNTFYPACKEISFNATLRHNDGLLVDSYMKKYNVDYQKAYRMLEDDVNEIKDMLARGMKVSLDAIGTFQNGREGQIVFTADRYNPFSTETYGLSSFRLQTLRTLQREEAALRAQQNKPGKDTLYIPINRKVLRGIASAAAAIALFLIVSTPIKDVDTHSYTASFIPTQVAVATTTTTAPTTAVPKATIAPAVVEESPVYYVIVSTVSSAKQANAILAGMDKSVYKHANTLKGDSKIRVYADKFDNREKADNYMAKLRKNPKYADAWIYVNP